MYSSPNQHRDNWYGHYLHPQRHSEFMQPLGKQMRIRIEENIRNESKWQDNKYLSIMILNVNGLDSPVKDIHWKIGLKNMTQLYVVWHIAQAKTSQN